MEANSIISIVQFKSGKQLKLCETIHITIIPLYDYFTSMLEWILERKPGLNHLEVNSHAFKNTITKMNTSFCFKDMIIFCICRGSIFQSRKLSNSTKQNEMIECINLK